MSTQIDPVTGLPMYVPPPLEQIPFKNPPYPWKDLTDNPVAPRTTYYGDDSIPTVATVSGMLPGTPGGETVETDGNHALKVSVVNGGSSGGAALKPTKVVYAFDRAFNAINGEPMLNPVSQLDYNLKVLMFSGQLSMTESSYTLQSSDDAALGIMDTNSGLVLWILDFPFYMQPGTSPVFGMFGGYQSLTFPNGLDLTGFFAPSAVLYPCVGGSNQHMYGSAIVWQG